MERDDKKKAWLFWGLLGVFAIGIISTALEVGDDSECPDGFGIYTNGSIWGCIDLNNLNQEDNDFHLFINHSYNNNINYYINNSDAVDVHIHVIDGKYFVFGDTLK